jgi:hypothetical protein
MVVGDWHGNATWGMALIRHARKLGITTLLQVGDFVSGAGDGRNDAEP